MMNDAMIDPGKEAVIESSGPKDALWNKFYVELEEASMDTDVKYSKQLVEHIAAIRNRQYLPPFFALLTGPAIVPYLVESLCVTLGRVSSRCKLVDVNLGDISKISRHHCTIRYELDCRGFVVINHSKNGIRVQNGDKWMEVLTEGERVPLPNPATLYIQGELVYFQVFYVVSPDDLTPEDLSHLAAHGAQELAVKSKRKLTSCNLELSPAASPGQPSPAQLPSGLAAPGIMGAVPVNAGGAAGAAASSGSMIGGTLNGMSAGGSPLAAGSNGTMGLGGAAGMVDEPSRKRPRVYSPRAEGEGRQYTFSELIIQALNDLGGAATQASITAWIEANHPAQIQGRKTWRNSVSGVLSANSIFVRVPSEVKQRRPLWKLFDASEQKKLSS